MGSLISVTGLVPPLLRQQTFSGKLVDDRRLAGTAPMQKKPTKSRMARDRSSTRCARDFGESVWKVLLLLDKRSGEVSMGEMAEIIGRSIRQSREIFRHIAGESFRTAQLRARLACARVLVCRYSIPISRIAEDFGYSRRAKFDTSYKKLFGVSPARDRRLSQLAAMQKTASQG